MTTAPTSKNDYFSKMVKLDFDLIKYGPRNVKSVFTFQ